MSEFAIEHEDQPSGGRFVHYQDQRMLAEMTYSRTGPHLLIIDHTFVDPVLRGQGAGQKILHALVEWVRQEQIRVIPLCPFAKAQFEKDTSLSDVLQ
ncbi:MAG: GNAT family N-acetyltransferase [Candidatus Sericytochromatia bacterium]